MSLINQMLQELDARGSDGARNGSAYANNVRAVPEARRNYLAWGVAVVIAMLVGGAASWIWLRTTTMPLQAPPSELPLKLSPRLQAPYIRAEVPADVPQPSTAIPPESQIVTVPQGELKARAASVMAESAAVAQQINAQRSLPQAALPVPHVDLAVSVDSALLKTGKRESAKASGVAASAIAKDVKELTPRQLAENEYRRASTLIAQGKPNDAIAALEHALQGDPSHAAARQTLVGLLVEGRRQDDAIRRLQEGLALDERQVGMAMILARLQVEKKDVKTAVDVLQRSLPYADERSDYLAFLAALEQRQGRHKDAIDHYFAALKTAPQNAVWWMGIGISLQAENHLADARDAFSRAKATDTLSPELQAFVEQRLAQLPR